MLTEEQKVEVAKWFAAGASLDEIQKRMKSEFNVHMTYLDVRLMVADLPQPVEPEPEPKATEVENDGLDDESAGSVGARSESADDAAEPPKRYDLDAPDADAGKPSPDVVVEMDTLTIPGTYASGTVTFSDGTKGKWYLDQQGRLGLGDVPEGYRPSPSDAALFQARLMDLLRNRGMV